MDTPAKLDQKCEGAGKMVQGSEFHPRDHESMLVGTLSLS